MKELITKSGLKIILRSAQADDAQNLLNYLEKSSAESDYLAFGKGELKMTLEQEHKFLDEVFKKQNSIYIIALDHEEIVGVLTFHGGNKRRVEHVGSLNLSVSREYWNVGISAALLTYLFDWAEMTDVVKKINLKVRTDHHVAIDFFKKYGFVIEGESTRGLVVHGLFYNVYYMGKEIN